MKSSRWCALYTRHQHEKSVAHGLSKIGMKAFLPLYTEVHQWRDRVKEISLPLFPNYVFVLGGLERRSEILSMAGIHDFVRLGVSPATIPDEEIEAVRQVVEAYRRVEPYPFLTTGERVRVISGPLKGLEGIPVRRKSLYRLVLSVELLARSIAVEVSAYDVERVVVPTVRRGLPATAQGLADSVHQGTTPIKIDVL